MPSKPPKDPDDDKLRPNVNEVAYRIAGGGSA